jgi:hypothetical protein
MLRNHVIPALSVPPFRPCKSTHTHPGTSSPRYNMNSIQAEASAKSNAHACMMKSTTQAPQCNMKTVQVEPKAAHASVDEAPRAATPPEEPSPEQPEEATKPVEPPPMEDVGAGLKDLLIQVGGDICSSEPYQRMQTQCNKCVASHRIDPARTPALVQMYTYVDVQMCRNGNLVRPATEACIHLWACVGEACIPY